jgi:hypothetical protein
LYPFSQKLKDVKGKRFEEILLMLSGLRKCIFPLKMIDKPMLPSESARPNLRS